MTMGVRLGIVVERSSSGVRAGTVTDAGGMGGPDPIGATRWRSSSCLPAIPATTAATPTPPARIMNARRDQFGIVPVGPPRPEDRPATPRDPAALRSPRDRPVAAPVPARLTDRSSNQPSTSRPAPTDTAVLTSASSGCTSGSPSEATKPTTPNAMKAPAAIA